MRSLFFVSDIGHHSQASIEYSLGDLLLPVSERLKAVQVPLDRLDGPVARNGVVGRNGVDAGLSRCSLGGSSEVCKGESSADPGRWLDGSGCDGGRRGSGSGSVCPLNVPSQGDIGKDTPYNSGKANEQGHQEVHDGHYGWLAVRWNVSGGD